MRGNPFARYVAVGPQWQGLPFPFLTAQDDPAGAAKVSLGFGVAAQTVDVGRVEAFEFQKGRRVSEFVNSSNYRASEPDAAWRKAARERIATIRKADLRSEVVDEGGQPVPDATAGARTTAHALRFGLSFTPHVRCARVLRPCSRRVPRTLSGWLEPDWLGSNRFSC